MRRKARISRYWMDNQGTPGYLIAPGFFCPTLELPWRNNKQNYSCITEGIYVCTLHNSPKFGLVYHITDVAGRTWILTHWGNLAGDRTLGYKTHSEGCVLLGSYRGKINGQRAVLLSLPMVKRFIDYMDRKDFELEIINKF